MKKKIVKKNFTLLELVVAFAIIGICFSVIVLKVHEAVYEHKYKNNIKKIDMYFDFCKKMAFSNQADISLKLSQRGQKIFCEMGTDENTGFFENTQKIKDSFEDLIFLFNGKKIDNLEILFSTTGEILPKGEIEFLDKKKKFNETKTIKLHSR